MVRTHKKIDGAWICLWSPSLVIFEMHLLDAWHEKSNPSPLPPHPSLAYKDRLKSLHLDVMIWTPLLMAACWARHALRANQSRTPLVGPREANLKPANSSFPFCEVGHWFNVWQVKGVIKVKGGRLRGVMVRYWPAACNCILHSQRKMQEWHVSVWFLHSWAITPPSDRWSWAH